MQQWQIFTSKALPLWVSLLVKKPITPALPASAEVRCEKLFLYIRRAYAGVQTLPCCCAPFIIFISNTWAANWDCQSLLAASSACHCASNVNALKWKPQKDSSNLNTIYHIDHANAVKILLNMFACCISFFYVCASACACMSVFCCLFGGLLALSSPLAHIATQEGSATPRF